MVSARASVRLSRVEQTVSTAEDTLQSHSLAIPARKRSRSTKPPSVKAAVISGRINGNSKLQIARDLRMSKNTVNRILEEADLDALMEDGRLSTLRRVPQALQVLDVRLEKNSENAAIWLLDKCFDGKKIAGKQEPGLTLAIQNLMGNVTVQSGAQDQQKPLDVKPVESAPVCVNADAEKQVEPK